MFYKQLRKLISTLIIITFFFTSINISYASPNSKSLFKNKKVDYDKISNQSQDTLQKKQSVLKGEDAKEIQSQQKEAKKILSSHLEDISQIHIPQDLGRIVEVYNNATSIDKKPNLIVHIQDLHTNPEAELNLAKILELLLKDYNMDLVLSEGAVGKVDTSSVSSFPDSSIREKVSRIFIDSGELTGEEYLSITKYPDLPIWGIETKDIYFNNIIGFNRIMKFNPSSQTFISQVKKAIIQLKLKVYSKDLLDLDNKESEFSSQKLDTAKYIQYLTGFTKKLNISKANYKNISLLTETMEKEKTIDQLKIMNQSQNLLLNLQSTLQNKSLNNDLDGLMARANLFKDQKISPFSFYSYLKDLANKHLKEEFALKYPELNSFVDYLTKVNSLDSTKLFTELEDLNFEIKEALSKTDEQKALVKTDHNINFLESFFNLKVSNEDLDYYLNNKDSHKVTFFKDFLPKTLKRYNINAFIDYNPDLIDSHLQELEDFYKVVKERDIAMVTNSLSEIEKRDSKVSSLIAGGFHTKGITRLLKEKGYSYIVVSPYSKTDIDEENYHFLLSGRRKPIEDLLKQLDLPKIIDNLLNYQKTLRVPLVFSGLEEAFNAEVAPALASIWGVETREVTLENIVERIVIELTIAAVKNPASLAKWKQPLADIEVSVPIGESGAVIVKLTPQKGYSMYFRLTKDNVEKAKTDDFKDGIKLVMAAVTTGSESARGAANQNNKAVIDTSTYSFLNNRLQGMGISVDQKGRLTYSDSAKSEGLDGDYKQAGTRTVGDLLRKKVIGKLANMAAEFSTIQETVLYNMIHGLVPTPRQGGWSTLNFTPFSPDFTEFPDGEIVKTTGHFNPQLDIQQVGQGEFISLQIKYDDKGNPVESRAQYLKPGDIFYALPGYFHVTIPVGDGPHSFFDIGYTDGTYKDAIYDWPNNTPAPYLFVNKGGKITVVLNPDYKNKEIPPIQWYTADKLPEVQDQVSLVDLYAKADESGVSRILDAIEKGKLPVGIEISRPANVTEEGLILVQKNKIIDNPDWINYRQVKFRFGTSGLRDFVRNISDLEVYIDVVGWVEYAESLGELDASSSDPEMKTIYIAKDLRHSSPRLARAIARVAYDKGYTAKFIGDVATPLGAYYAQYANKKPGLFIMVTGSHIPSDKGNPEIDQNGIKFYMRGREVLNSDIKPIYSHIEGARQRIYAMPGREANKIWNPSGSFVDSIDYLDYSVKQKDVEDFFIKRYVDFFCTNDNPNPYKGAKILVWQQTSVARDFMKRLFEALGAQVVTVDRREKFYAVDTEDIKPEQQAFMNKLAEQEYEWPDNTTSRPFRVASTDGDGDRPVYTDENGDFIVGGKLSLPAIEMLGFKACPVPVSGSRAIERKLKELGILLLKTKIGSPIVAEAMEFLAKWGFTPTYSHENNGGGLLGTDIVLPDGRTLKKLATRCAFLPQIGADLYAIERGIKPSEVFAEYEDFQDYALLRDLVAPDFMAAVVERLKPGDSKIREVKFLEDGRVEVVYYVDQEEGPEKVAEGDRKTLDSDFGITTELKAKRDFLQRFFNEREHEGEKLFGEIVEINFIDGIQFFFANGDRGHIRGSSNSPQFRFYSEGVKGERSVKDTKNRAVLMAEVCCKDGALGDEWPILMQLIEAVEREALINPTNDPASDVVKWLDQAGAKVPKLLVINLEGKPQELPVDEIIGAIESGTAVWSKLSKSGFAIQLGSNQENDFQRELEQQVRVMVMDSKAMGNVAVSDIENSARLVFEELKKAVQNVYGESGLSNADLRRTYMRTFYYWETSCYLNKDKDPVSMASNLSDWLEDEVIVEDIFGQPVGSLTNYAIVRDLSQGYRIREILDYISKARLGDLTREAFLKQFGLLTNETELLLIRMAQLEEKHSVEKRAVLLCNRELRDSIERYCAEPYKLTTDDVGRKYVRTGKLWAGTEGPYGILRYLGISEEQARQMGISEAETIKGIEGKVFAGETLVYFPNEQMSTRESLAGAVEPVSDYHINLLFGQDIMGTWAYKRFDGYQPYTIKYLFAGPGISNQIHLSKGLHGKPETFIMLAVHPELGEAVFGFKDGVTNEQIEDAFTKLDEGDQETLIGLMNILSAKRSEFKQGDVLNIPGNTAHTVGSVTGLALPEEVWISQIINQGIVGFLEIAYNQFAVSPFWVDPATLRIADPWVEKVQALLGVEVTARHIDTEDVLGYVGELTRATPQTAVMKPNSTARFAGEATKDIHEIGPHYNFSILKFGEENKDNILIDSDELGAAHNVIMALGTTESKRERLQVTLEYADGRANKEIVLSRGEGLRISAGFQGKISVKALDKGAWAVHVSVPESEPELVTDDDLFVSRGMAFKRRPEIKISRAVNSGV